MAGTGLVPRYRYLQLYFLYARLWAKKISQCYPTCMAIALAQSGGLTVIFLVQLYGAGQLEFQGSRPSSNLSDQQESDGRTGWDFLLGTKSSAPPWGFCS